MTIKVGDRIRSWGGDTGRILEVEDDAVFILMDNPEAVVDGDGETGVEICLLSDITEEEKGVRNEPTKSY